MIFDGPSLDGAPGPGTLVNVARSKSSSTAFQENSKIPSDAVENQALSDALVPLPYSMLLMLNSVITGI